MSEKIPAISVIIPNYNNATYLPDCLESILTQTFTDFECIVVDDGSSDDSWDILENFAKKDARIKIFRQEENRKICTTLNFALKKARGKYIARMDSDDICLPHRLEVQYEFLESHPKVGVVGGQARLIDKNKKTLKIKTYPQNICSSDFFSKNPLLHPATLIRKECFDLCGLYNEQYVYAEDLDLWMRFFEKFELKNLGEVVLLYRISGQNATLKNQRYMIYQTLQLRKLFKQKGYSIGYKYYILYLGTWCAQFLPPKLVFFIFHILH